MFNQNIIMNIKQQLDDLSKLDKEFKLSLYTKNNNNIATEELLKSTFRNGNRFTQDIGMEGAGLVISHGKENVLSIELTEFVPCCGKAIGRRMLARNSYYKAGNYVQIEEKKVKKAFNILFDLIDKIIENAKYTSISLIVSVPEQPLFYELIQDREGWKVTNEFKNERMSSKHHCIEYCKNYFGN